MYTYPGAELAAELRGSGFRARLVRGYGSYRFRAGQAGLIARKAGVPPPGRRETRGCMVPGFRFAAAGASPQG